MDKIDGEWKLVYTSNSELIAVLALSKLPFVTVGDVGDGLVGGVVCPEGSGLGACWGGGRRVSQML